MAQPRGPKREVARFHPFLLNSVDCQGRSVDSFVLSVAQDIAPRAVAYAQKSLADPCLAVNLLEEAAATVSEAVLTKQTSNLAPIRDVRAYLYRAFLRRVSAQRQTDLRLEYAFEDHFRLNEAKGFEEILEARLLLKQILCKCDRKTRWIVWGRIEGRSWDEIAYDMVMSNRAARLHYSRSVRKIREVFDANRKMSIEELQHAKPGRQGSERLISFFKTFFTLRLFPVIRAKPVLGVRFRITHHETEEMLAAVEDMFS